MFYIEIPIATRGQGETPTKQVTEHTQKKATRDDEAFGELCVLLIDNDELLLSALQQQLAQWTERVIAVKSLAEWQQLNDQERQQPDVIIADYHLDDGENGIESAQQILGQLQTEIPVIIVSADASEWLREAVSEANYSFIRKPIKSLALRKLILKQLNSSAV